MAYYENGYLVETNDPIVLYHDNPDGDRHTWRGTLTWAYGATSVEEAECPECGAEYSDYDPDEDDDEYAEDLAWRVKHENDEYVADLAWRASRDA